MPDTTIIKTANGMPRVKIRKVITLFIKTYKSFHEQAGPPEQPQGTKPEQVAASAGNAPNNKTRARAKINKILVVSRFITFILFVIPAQAGMTPRLLITKQQINPTIGITDCL